MLSTFYSQNAKFFLAVDCIIFGFQRGNLKLLLQQRHFEPFKGEWSLMGGFVQENESLDDAAKRVLYDLTGLSEVYMEQVGAFGAVDRDPGARVVSVAYYALLDIDKCNHELKHQYNAHWESIENLPNLFFDHSEMVEKARALLKKKISREPIGFNLLPSLFTLSQLQSLYEAILGEAIDKRNFRKRVNEMSFIEKTDQIDKLGSKRGAYLYKFNNQAYHKVQTFKL